jgi:UPF0755 protein
MSRSSRRFTLIVLAVVAIAVVAGALFYRHTRSWLHSPIASLTETTVYEVARGAALGPVLNDLQRRGWVRHAREIGLWIKFSRPDYALRAGEYELQPGMSPVELVDLLGSGRVLLHKLTIVEGSTLRELRAALSAHPQLRSVTNGMSNASLIKTLGDDAAHGEGLFFPDTYRFAKGTTDLEILRMAHMRMRAELDRAWSNREPGLPLANAYEALILASIVEKETGLASERAQIAGVFVERLRRGMRLQTDPTVIYGMGESFDGNIRKADLQRDTPYNTYTRRGLPPTPICLPGAAALDAAVRPNVTGALFFVATGKGDGSHYFSRTLEEHNAALRRYLQTLRRR